MGLIRILLAISVIASHSDALFGFNFVGGGLAVQAFFMISGFYMALILSGKYNASANWGGYKLFITNRLAKLYPAYWLVCLMILLTAVVTYLMRGTLFTMNIWGDHIDSLSIGTLATLLFSNLSLLLQDVLWWFGINYDTGSLFYTPEILSLPADIRSIEYILIPPAWSVSLEITFYLIAPFLAKRKSYILWLLIAASFALRFGLPAMGLAYDPWVYRFFPSNLAFFLLGIMGYRYYPYIARWYDGSPKKEWLVRAIYLLNIVLIFTYSFLPQTSYTPYLFLAVVCVSIPFIFLLSKHWTRDRYIGELSYPIYIVHLFVLMVVKHWVSALGLGKDWQGEVCLLVTLILSVLMNELLLKRIDKYRQSRVKAVA